LNKKREMFQQLEDIGTDKVKEENEKARKRIEAPLKRKSLIPTVKAAESDEWSINMPLSSTQL